MINIEKYNETIAQLNEVKDICLAEAVKDLDFFEEAPIEALRFGQKLCKLYRMTIELCDDAVKTTNDLQKKLIEADKKLDDRERQLHMMDDKLDRILKMANRSQSDKTGK